MIERIAWMQMLALSGHDARRWEPKRLRLLSIASVIARRSRRTWLRLSAHVPHSKLIATGLTQLRNLPSLT